MRRARAVRWITALVDPPMAAKTRIAFSNASLTRILERKTFSFTSSTMRRPATRARTCLRASTAGIAALPGMPTPSASIIDAIVDAVPIVMQWPCERCMQDSASWNSSSVILPARRSSDIDQVLVPEPMSLPWYLPESIGPPETRIVGRSTLHAPMRVAGVGLLRAAGKDTPPGGWARGDSLPPTLAGLGVGIAGGGGSRSAGALNLD